MNEIKNQPEPLRLAEMYDFGDPAAHGNAWKSAVCAELRRQHARISGLEAARIAYASEFKPDADGDPDVGNIHANIRALKAQLASTQAAADMGIPTSTSPVLSDEQIKAVFLANGFTIKEGLTDLKPYVYQAARALLAASGQQGLDAARLEMLTAVEDSGEGLRYGLECLVDDGVNTFNVYDEQREEYLVDCWVKDPLAAIDAALNNRRNL
jgi:hypothetical protein